MLHRAIIKARDTTRSIHSTLRPRITALILVLAMLLYVSCTRLVIVVSLIACCDHSRISHNHLLSTHLLRAPHQKYRTRPVHSAMRKRTGGFEFDISTPTMLSLTRTCSLDVATTVLYTTSINE